MVKELETGENKGNRFFIQLNHDFLLVVAYVYF